MSPRARLFALALQAAALPIGATLPARADGRPEVELPVVPASVDPRGRKAAAIPALADGTITVAPGETKALVVSAGNVNRIVTPFAQPDIVTTAPDQFTIRQNVVYAAPAAPAPGQPPEPLTLYLTEKGDESTAISLILLPRLQVASREFRLVLAGAHGGAAIRTSGSARRAAAWEQDQPYPAMLAELLARLAAGSVPQGYDLGPPDTAAAPALTGGDAAPLRSDWRAGLEAEALDRLARRESGVMDRLQRDFERTLLRVGLRQAGGRRGEAALRLGIGRNTLTRKCRELGLDNPDGDEAPGASGG